MKHKYYNLDDCVRIYKEAKGRERDEAFDAILAHLTHHTNSILNIMKNTDYYADKRISKMMMSNMKRTVAIKDNAEAAYFFQTMSRDIDIEDAKQMIYTEILTILESYKYMEITFLQYVTFLLPIRIASRLVKKSKDVMNQFAISFYSPVESEDKDSNPLLEYNIEEQDEMALLSEFISDDELSFLEDLANGEPDELLAKKYMISYKELQHYKKSIKYRIKNVIDSQVHKM